MLDIVEEFWSHETLEEIFALGAVQPAEFAGAFKTFLSSSGKIVLTGSARLALRSLLQSLGACRPTRRVVLLSAFNCRVVLDAVLSAGMEVELFDLRSPCGEFDWAAIGRSLASRHLAIVTPHFFGVPTDIRPLTEYASKAGVITIEDCAHTLGGSVGGRPAGTIGDAAIFSFNYDKPISLGGGGALLINTPGIPVPPTACFPPPDDALEARALHNLLRHLSHRRNNYDSPRIVRRAFSALARLEVSPFAMPRLPTGIGALRAALGVWQLRRFPSIMASRNRNAEQVAALFGGKTWSVDANCQPSWLRQRVLFDTGANDMAAKLQRIGMRAANLNWPRTLDQELGHLPQPNARAAASQAIDIPIHQNINPQLLASALAGGR